MIVDIHVHPFTAESLTMLSETFWEHPRTNFGIQAESLTIETTIQHLDEAGVDRAVLLALDAETSGGGIVSNDYVAGLVQAHPERFLGFASVDPGKGALRAADEIERALRDLKLVGIKFHPVYQQFAPNDPVCYPIYEVAAKYDAPLLVHTGHTFVGGRVKYGHPTLLDDVAADFPTLKILAVHFGFPWTEEACSLAWTRPNVYLELSGWAPRHIPEIVWRLGKRFFPDRMVFGSDYPVLMPKRWLDEFATLPFPDTLKEQIVGGTAAKLLKLA